MALQSATRERQEMIWQLWFPTTIDCSLRLVARAGFEPAISALKGLRPSPLDDRAVWKV